MNNEKQLNIKFTNEEFEVIDILKKKYAINISQFLKNCLSQKLEQLKKEKEQIL